MAEKKTEERWGDRPDRPPRQDGVAIKSVLLTILWASLATFAFSALCRDALRDYRKHRAEERARSSGALETCAWATLKPHASLLEVPAIGRPEFLARQQTLAAALRDAGADAFVAEPSASSEYYANVSSSYSLSERPFLVIIDRAGAFSYLVPRFEAGRVARLDMVYGGEKTVVEWREEESPYEVFARATGYRRVVLDEHVRFMIAAGLADAGVEVVPMPLAIQSLRAVKTDAEVAILRAINEFTLELVRSLQRCLEVGVTTQEAVVEAGRALFARAGADPGGYWALALFGELAAYPHGGGGGGAGRTLRDGEFVLIDIGSALHGYRSDVTRTILPRGGNASDELLGIWHTVRAAQSAGLERMHAGETCAEVDAASRVPVQEAGYAPFYTHRLGHGLGLEVHEHPYLNGANKEVLKLGHVATNEPVSRKKPPEALPNVCMRELCY